jgi:hypothetical protein
MNFLVPLSSVFLINNFGGLEVLKMFFCCLKDGESNIYITKPGFRVGNISLSIRKKCSKYKSNSVCIKGRKVKELFLDKKHGIIEWHTNEVRAGLYFYSIAKGKHVLDSGQILIAH